MTTPPKLPPLPEGWGWMSDWAGEGASIERVRPGHSAVWVEGDADGLTVTEDDSTPYNGYRAIIGVPWAVVFEHARRAGYHCTPPAEPDPWALLATVRADVIRSCAELVRLVAPDHMPDDVVMREDVVDIAMRLKSIIDAALAARPR